ncbi:MAG: sigma-70 family RNA polymerase sigma factor [Bacteriovorax sp.]|nr:sigma-70 family RNA polymerase sigma factor [Rhizobacter sp.]
MRAVFRPAGVGDLVPGSPRSAASSSAPPCTEPQCELAALLLKIDGGCRVSFERVYRLTSRRLFGIVLRINRDRPEAEEVLQEVYVKVWRQCSQFDARKGEAIHWLAGMAHHSAIDSLRHRQRRPLATALPLANGEDDAYAGLVSGWPEPIENVIRNRAEQAVHAGLCALPDEQRESLMLAFFDGLTHPEIALQMARPLGTVKSWVRRSLAALREPLDGHL